jgi:hypothetical protein
VAATRNRVVLASRYERRAARFLENRAHPFVPLSAPGLTTEEIGDLLRSAATGVGVGSAAVRDERGLREVATVVCRLSDGRPAYADAIVAAMHEMSATGGGDPVSALAALLSPGGGLARRCEHSYEIRLHRARGYGALKAILDILSEAESLTLTEISRRLHRTPGSTKDYLSWLEDVDLIAAWHKRYGFRDPLLRLWVRLYCRPAPPSDELIALEVQRHAERRLRASPPEEGSATVPADPAVSPRA